MLETTQGALREMAAKHIGNPMVDSVLLTIQEAELGARQALGQVTAIADLRSDALDHPEHRSVPWDNSDLVLAAGNAQAHLTVLSRAYATLASVLTKLGEPILY